MIFYCIRFDAVYSMMCPKSANADRVNPIVVEAALMKAEVEEKEAKHVSKWVKWYIDNCPSHYSAVRSYGHTAAFSHTYIETVNFPRSVLLRSSVKLPQINVRDTEATTTVKLDDDIVAVYEMKILHFRVLEISYSQASSCVSSNPEWMVRPTYKIEKEKTGGVAISNLVKKALPAKET